MSDKKIDKEAREKLANHPAHYTGHPSGIEAKEVCGGLNFYVGSALKYAWRLGKKDDPRLEVAKVLWYCTEELNAPLSYSLSFDPSNISTKWLTWLSFETPGPMTQAMRCLYHYWYDRDAKSLEEAIALVKAYQSELGV